MLVLIVLTVAVVLTVCNLAMVGMLLGERLSMHRISRGPKYYRRLRKATKGRSKPLDPKGEVTKEPSTGPTQLQDIPQFARLFKR